MCTGCEQEVVAKCGLIVCWHWAHRADDCDLWYEPMSAWHRAWQNRFPREQTEVVMRRDGEHHRADIVLGHGGVLELQASAISVEDIARREKFYKHMAWLFRCDWADRLIRHEHKRFAVMLDGQVCCTEDTEIESRRVAEIMRDRGYDAYALRLPIRPCEMKWRHPRRSIASVTKPMFWHVETVRQVWRVTLTGKGRNIVIEREWDEDDFAKACARASGVFSAA